MQTRALCFPEEMPAARVLKLRDVPRALRGPALLALVSGRVRVRGGFCTDSLEVVQVEGRDVVALSPGRHAAVAACRSFAEVIVIEIGDSWAEQAPRLAGVRAGAASVMLFVERDGTPLARRAHRVLDELAAPPGEAPPSERLRAASKLLELLAVLYEERSQVLEPGTRRIGRRREEFRPAVQRLASGSLEELTLESFAHGIGFSPRQVSRLFREEFGTTFREHLVDLRLEGRKALLERTQHSIVAVAAETGSSSLTHFNSVFRRRIGATPSSYRAQRVSEPGP